MVGCGGGQPALLPLVERRGVAGSASARTMPATSDLDDGCQTVAFTIGETLEHQPSLSLVSVAKRQKTGAVYECATSLTRAIVSIGATEHVAVGAAASLPG
jgi:hypothetical protein